MNPTEKRIRHQTQQKLDRLRREDAKPSTIERLQRSIAGQPHVVQKGKVLRGK